MQKHPKELEVDEAILYERHAEQIRSAQPRFEALIGEVTGWKGVGDLAKWTVELLIANQGGSAAAGVRPPCQGEHAPMSVAAFRTMLVQASNRTADDPIIEEQIEAHRQQLRTRFGL